MPLSRPESETVHEEEEEEEEQVGVRLSDNSIRCMLTEGCVRCDERNGESRKLCT